MKTTHYAARTALALALLQAWPGMTSAQSQTAATEVTAADLQKLQESINAMRSQYEQRINALEGKVNSLQKQNAELGAQVKRAQSATPVAAPTDTRSVGNPVAASATVKPGAATPATAGKAGASPAAASGGAPTDATLATTSPGSAAGAAGARAPVASAAPAPSLHSGITLPKIGVLTPEISLIIDGKYSSQSQNPDRPIAGFMPSGAENVPRGFSLGESELAIAGTVDNLFRAEARITLSQNGSGTNVNAEEIFFETLGLPAGLKVKAGKYFSSICYLNSKHPHEWDFVDLPLAYQAFLGGQLNDTGVQANWIVPLEDYYLRLGGEYGQGTSYPNSNNFNQNIPRLGTLFAKMGGDFNESASWQGGLSFIRASTGDTPRTSELGSGQTYEFNGSTNIYVADFVYKWAPNGNPTRQNFKFQTEFFWNNLNGAGVYATAQPDSVCQTPCPGNAFSQMQSGWYAQAIYQFVPNWRVGYRYDQLYSGNATYGFAPGTFNSTPLESWNPNRNTVMLDWINSEYSMFRLQLARDTSLGPGLVNNQVFLQYVMSLGPHGAHRF